MPFRYLFWSFFFFNLKEHDEPILKHLKDIKVKFSDAGQPMVKESWNISSFVALDVYIVDHWNFLKKGGHSAIRRGSEKKLKMIFGSFNW